MSLGIRGRLIIAMGYVGLTVVIALAVPLGATLERRARTALENRNLLRATALAQRLNEWNVSPDGREATQIFLDRSAANFGARVLFVDADGAVIADSDGADPGTMYATPGRPEIVRALRGTPWSDVRYSRDLGMDLMATAVPVVEEIEGTGRIAIIGAIRITQDLEETSEAVQRTVIGLIGIGGTALAVALGLGWLLADSLARPMRRLAAAARRFGRGDLSARAGESATTSEVAELASSFDAMADRVERLVRAQRDFVADASHQIRTPLTGVKLQLAEARAADPSGPAVPALGAAEREIDRLTDIVGRMLTKASEEGTRKVATADLRAAVGRAQVRWRRRVARAGRRLDAEGPSVRVVADGADLDEICDTLVDNALRYGAGPIELRVESDDELGWLRVSDRGRGIPAEDVERVTRRFERGRGAGGEGSGLGLAIVRERVEHWGGSLVLATGADGMTASASFPLADGGTA